MKKHILLWGWIFCLLSISEAQISYGISYFEQAGNPGGLNTEMDYDVTGWTTVMAGGFMSNQWSASINLPFSFEFYGQSFTQVKASANGVLVFAPPGPNGTPPGNNQALPSAALPDYSIAAFWESFAQNPPVLASDEIITKTFGTAPHRQFWIKWASYQWGSSSFVYLAAVLEEGSNNIYLVDQYSNPSAASGITATVGVQENLQSAVFEGSNLGLEQLGFHYIDNHYYQLSPFVIPPEDLKPLSITSPKGENCGMGLEPVTFSFKNNGQQSASGYVATLLHDQQVVVSDTLNDTLAPGDSSLHTFSLPFDFSIPGSHDLTMVVSSINDGNVNNDSLDVKITHTREISTFPFKENFESGHHGWQTGGSNSSWQWATPADSVIMGAASGIKAWVTNSQGNYNPFENSWVESPCFDLSQVGSDTWVSFKVWWETEEIWDGASLIATTDGGDTWMQVGNSNLQEWFNAAFIATLPGGAGEGWAGNIQAGSGSGGWKKVCTKLPPALIGAPNVRFRIAFASNSANEYRGFAFDDFSIGRPPVFSLGNDRYFCDGDTLRMAGVAGSYTWSEGSEKEYVVIRSSGQGEVIDSMLTLRIVDSLGLERRDTLYFSVSPQLKANLVSVQHVACFGGSTGSISVELEGGKAPFAFLWNNQAQTQNLTDIGRGAYSLEVSDINGCQSSLGSIEVQQGDSMGIDTEIKDLACHGDSLGRIEVRPFGGAGAYTYEWSNGDSTSVLDSLKAGRYDLTLKDGLGCSLEESLAVFEPEPITAVIVDTQHLACDGGNEGALILDIRGGQEPYLSFSIDDAMEVGGIQSLEEGGYEVYVEDSASCIAYVGRVEIESKEEEFYAGFEYSLSDSSISVRDTSLGADSVWFDFGDGNRIMGSDSISYIYDSNGTYLVSQYIFNPCGRDTATASIEIKGIVEQEDSTQTSLSHAWKGAEIHVYPNPSRGRLYFKTGAPIYGNVTLALLDLRGKILWEGRFESLPEKLDLPSSLGSGLYYLQISMGSYRLSRKIQIE